MKSFFLQNKENLSMEKNLKIYEKAKGRVIIRILTNYLGINLNSIRILEIGCSTGALMELLEQNGGDVYGIDIESPWSKCYYYDENKRLFCDLQEEDISFKIGNFDLIIAQEVIEHIKKPYDFLVNTHKLLNIGGKILLTTPNLTGITAFLKGEKWCGTATESHMLLYTKRSLDFLLNNCGFKKIKSFTNIIPIVYQNKYPWLWWLNRLFSGIGVGGGIVAMYKKIPMIIK